MLTEAEKLLLREAIGVARQSALRSLDDALRILNQQIIDGDYFYSLIGAANIAEAERLADAVFPGAYTSAWSALRRVLSVAPPIEKPPETPVPDVGNPDSPDIPPAPPQVPSDMREAVRQALASYDIHIDNGRLSIGWEIDYETQAPLQIGGRVAAEIQGRSNVNKTDGQNRDEPHVNTQVLCDNDGGWRVRQYQKWWNGRVRNTTNRKAATIALDSVGDLCGSHIEVGASSDGGQSWYIRTQGKVVDFATYKVGGLIRILKSVSGYGAADEQIL